MDSGRINDLVVIQRHHRGTGEDVKIVDQADQDGRGWRDAARIQQGERVDDTGERVDDTHLGSAA